ncbi:hypothetical protein DH2020_034243 [Rehmannia glutinosa]|uniref:Uncharacterized protein n=1 Tax=Rehmannia glutinosa TaxID=99300 RepID=A0ABR0V9X1_REHGL
MEEILTERGKSLAAPVIFILVFSFHFVSKYLESYKRKKGSMSDVDIRLRAEIKQLLKEASSLTQPSTFAQAAKLRRMAAAKEKELAKHLVRPTKSFIYEPLIFAGKLLSWRAGKSLKDNVVVGIIPWLIVSTRVSKFICRKVLN